MDRLQIDAFGIAPHTLRSFSQVAGDNDSSEPSTGESSESEFIEPPSSAFQESAEECEMKSGSPPKKRDSSGSNSGAHYHHGHRSSRSRSIPLVDIQPDLIDLYFEHVHPFLLVLHKPSFFRRLEDPKDPVPDFLLAAMYAVASHYAPGREQEGRRYFELWLSRLDDTLDKPRLSTIQALLMVIKYQEGVRHSGFYFRTYMYTQMVIVLARELQLHKTTPVNAKLDPESHEVRRRLFWAIFVLDQFMSVSQGRTMSFREVEPDADLPRTDNEDPNDPEEIEVIQNAVEYIKLVKIDHQALILVRKFLTKAVSPEETIPQGLFLHQAMFAWKANLPPRLQLASNMSPHTPFVAMLHVLYHACAIMIQRCYCEEPSVSHLEIAAVAKETCTVAATSITVIIDDLYTNHGMVPLTYPIRGCYFVIYCLIAAATIQLNDIRRGTNGPIMFKQSLELLNHFLRESTAVDVEKEVALLKSSLDTAMESSPYSDTASATPHYDHRPPLKPILPMSQKYSSKLNFGSSSVTPIRPRKITPKASNSSAGNLSQALKNGSGHVRCSSTSTISSMSDQRMDANTSDQSGSSTSANKADSMVCSQSPSSQLLDDDLDIAIKSSPSPIMSSRSISSTLHNSDTSVTSPDSFLRSVPTFTAPASLPSDFNAFAQAQQQALAANGNQNPPPLMSLAQFLGFQQDRHRLQKQQQRLDQMTATQIQEQHRMNQQRQVLQLQQLQQLQQQQQQKQYQAIQQQQQQDPALFNSFLNNFSSLNNYQQLNSDQAQNELMSMLDSSLFNYNDNDNSALGLTSNAFMQLQQQQQHQQQQQQAHQQSGASQDQQDGLSSSLSPSCTTQSSSFSPDMNQTSSFGASYFLPSVTQQQSQQQDRQRTASSDDSLLGDAALARNHLQDTPSPETFPILDMASSFPSYVGMDSNLPYGIRQSLEDADKIFKFQAETGLASE
ncbi:fungal-specific transcription factor domain-containing protein [Dissophora ornata]|nr:fungal-specific transcription factor domain-containing protein [Dissophora ornata]